MFELLRESFASLAKVSIFAYTPTFDEFNEFVSSPDSVTFAAFDNDGRAVAQIGLTVDLSLVPFLSLPYVQRNLRQAFEQRRVMYALFACLRRSTKLKGVYDDLQAFLAEFLAANRMVVMADMCSFNTATGYVDKVFSGMEQAGPGVRCKHLDAQNFVVMDMTEAENPEHKPVWR